MERQLSPSQLRQRIRAGSYRGHTSGLAAGYVQCNLVILPVAWAADFRQFCNLNPKPCPLVSVGNPGDWRMQDVGEGIDIRTDVPMYRIFREGLLVDEVNDINRYWSDDLVVFLLGCSFSFEEALLGAGLQIRNISEAVNVPMYRTDIPCQAAGPFQGNMVVSMRPFKPEDVSRAVAISRQFPDVHGEPVHIGDPSLIGIGNLSSPDFGDAVTVYSGEIPVFWACGVTPQVVLEQAKPPLCITHSPGAMLVTDLENG